MLANSDQNQFLEAALKNLMTANPAAKHIVVAWSDEDNDVYFSYYRCSYADLQHIGQEMINEGTIQLVGMNKARISQIEAETELDNSDEA